MGSGFHKVWTPLVPGANGQTTMTLHNYGSKQYSSSLNAINLSNGLEIWIPQTLDLNSTRFHKILCNGQFHIGQMGKWAWRCTTSAIGNSIEEQRGTTIQLQPEGLRGKKYVGNNIYMYSLLMHRIKTKSSAIFLWNEQNVFVGGFITFQSALTLAVLQWQKSLPDIGGTTVQDVAPRSHGAWCPHHERQVQFIDALHQN